MHPHSLSHFSTPYSSFIHILFFNCMNSLCKFCIINIILKYLFPFSRLIFYFWCSFWVQIFFFSFFFVPPRRYFFIECLFVLLLKLNPQNIAKINVKKIISCVFEYIWFQVSWFLIHFKFIIFIWNKMIYFFNFFCIWLSNYTNTDSWRNFNIFIV